MSYKVISTCLKCSLLGLFLLLLQPVHSQRKQDYFSPKYNWSDLNKELEADQKLLGNNLVMLVWKNDDSLIYKREMGDFSSRTQAPIASCSKWLTAALLMIFVDEGTLSLDDKVSRWLPEFAKYGKNYITLRNCLSHMTGIDDEGGLLKKLFQRKKFMTLEEEVNSFAARDIRANPGTDFWYGNVGLNIAGRIMEIVSKKRFDILIKQKLFNPLAMRRTSFTSMTADPINPSGSAMSTAEDYMKFLVMLMNKGKSPTGQQVLSEESVNTLMQIQTKPEMIKYAPKPAEGYNYALGSWVVESPLLTSPVGGGTATVLACPGLFGTWPMVDFCRGYAYLVFVKNLLGEERAETHINLKKTIDAQISGNCP